MSSPVLLVDRIGAIGILTLNRPHAMNALNLQLRRGLSEAFRDLQADPMMKVLILTGAGRAFCCGMDLKELASGARTARDGDAASGWDMMDAMAAFDGPIIAAVNGHAITAGLELALACDLIIASSTAKFADTHARVGMLPGWGLSQRLPRLIGVARAKELSFTGNTITAERACEWGLVNRVVAAQDLLSVCKELAGEMASTVPGLLTAYKKLIDEGYGMPMAQAMNHERSQASRFADAASASAIAARQEGVLTRGRAQSKDERD